MINWQLLLLLSIHHLLHGMTLHWYRSTLHRRDLLIHVAVDFLTLKIEVCAVRLHGRGSHILCFSLIILHDCLGLANIACASVLRALHEDVLLDHFSVRKLCELLALTALLELLGDDAEALVPI